MRRDDGFTLIETLVALAVLATGAVALLGVVEDHTGRIAGLEDRVTLRWVAENRLGCGLWPPGRGDRGRADIDRRRPYRTDRDGRGRARRRRAARLYLVGKGTT